VSVDELRAAGGDVWARRDDACRHRRVQRKDLVLLRFGDEHLLQFLDFLRVLGREVLGLAEVRGQVEELQHLVVQRIWIGRAVGLPGRAIDLGAQEPAVVVQRPLAHHLKVLGRVLRGCFGVSGIERIGEAGALDWRLLDAVDDALLRPTVTGASR